MEKMLRRNEGRNILGGMDQTVKFRGPGIISKRGAHRGHEFYDLENDGPGGTMDFDLGPGIIS